MDPTAESRIARGLLRERLLRLRADTDAVTRTQWDRAIAERLPAIEPLARAATIAVYWPIRAEPELGAVLAQWRSLGKRLALPVVGGPNRGLLFCAWDADATLIEGPYGIAIPQEKVVVEPDCLVIPCIGFRFVEGAVHRLGYGAGYYDRTLAHRRARAQRETEVRPLAAVGVAYDVAETDAFTPNPSDEPLSSIVTPSRVISSIASP